MNRYEARAYGRGQRVWDLEKGRWVSKVYLGNSREINKEMRRLELENAKDEGDQR